MTEKVSVIIPVYNIEKYISKCVESVLNQTYKNIEIILVDDGSKDSSASICKWYSEKYNSIYVYTQKNKGVSAARNLGLEKSTGDFICFVDGDDIIEYNMIEQLYNYFIKYDVDIVMTDISFCYPNGNILKKRKSYKLLINDQKKMLNMFLTGDILLNTVADKMFKREIIGNTRFMEGYAVGEDMYFFYNILKKAQTMYIDTELPLYKYMIRKDSAMNSKFNSGYLDTIYLSQNILEDCIGTIYYKKAYAHLIHEECKLVEYMLLNSYDEEFEVKKEEAMILIRKYSLFEAFRNLSLKKFVGILLMKISPNLYLSVFKKINKI